MRYRNFGRTGLTVSRLCLGTASFGRDADEAEAQQIFDRAMAMGINFVDTANAYNQGGSELILGKCIRSYRDRIILASKAYFPMSRDMNDRGANRRHLRQAVEASLGRLSTDYLDVLYLHSFDSQTPMEETLRVLDDLVRGGKVLYVGVSNWSAWQIATALGIARKEGLPEIRCVQPMYNLVKRQAEVEILPLAQAEDFAIAPYNVLAGGLLTGKYSLGADVQGRLMQDPLTRTRYRDQGNFDVAQRLTDFASELGVEPAALAVAWTLGNPAVTSPIIGVRSVEQLAPWAAALEIAMTDELHQQVSALSPEPPPATDRSEERDGITPG